MDNPELDNILNNLYDTAFEYGQDNYCPDEVGKGIVRAKQLLIVRERRLALEAKIEEISFLVECGVLDKSYASGATLALQAELNQLKERER